MSNDTVELLKEIVEAFSESAGLSEKEKLVFVLFKVDQRSVRDVASQAGVSKSNVHALAERAQAKLARYVHRVGPDKAPILSEAEHLALGDHEAVLGQHGDRPRDRWGRRVRYDSSGAEIAPGEDDRA